MIFVNPLAGVITSGYSPARMHPKLKEVWPHWGTDIGGRPRNPLTTHWIHSAADGTVIAAYGNWMRDNTATRRTRQYLSRLTGNHVVIEHANIGGKTFRTYYGHFARVTVKPGDTVRTGDKIGTQGATGNVSGAHLHLEVWLNGVATDPAAFFRSHGVNLGSGPTTYGIRDKRIEDIMAKLDRDDYQEIAKHVWEFQNRKGAPSVWTMLNRALDRANKTNNSQGYVERLVKAIADKSGVNL